MILIRGKLVTLQVHLSAATLFMNRIIYFTVVLGALFFVSCDDDDPSIDPREEVIGSYQLNNLTGSTFVDNFVVQTPPQLEVKYDPSLDQDEIYMDVEPFAESILEELTFLQFNTRDIIRAQIPKDEQLAKLKGTTFELEDVEFITIYTSAINDNDILVCELDLSGEINGTTISFDFEMLAIGQNSSYYVEGSSSGTIIQ